MARLDRRVEQSGRADGRKAGQRPASSKAVEMAAGKAAITDLQGENPL